MFFKVRLLHRIIALVIINVHLGGCSGYKWTTKYEYNEELTENQIAFIIYDNIEPRTYELVKAENTAKGYSGMINIDDEIEFVPRIKGAVVFYTDSVSSGMVERNGWSEVLISSKSITMVRVLEFDKMVKVRRTAILIAVPIITAAMVTYALSNMSVDFSGAEYITTPPSW